MGIDEEITAALQNSDREIYARLLRIARDHIHELEDEVAKIAGNWAVVDQLQKRIRELEAERDDTNIAHANRRAARNIHESHCKVPHGGSECTCSI